MRRGSRSPCRAGCAFRRRLLLLQRRQTPDSGRLLSSRSSRFCCPGTRRCCCPSGCCRIHRRRNQRCSLACHQHENGIFQLAETQRAHSRFPGHAFCAAVPGQVFVGTIHIVFAVVQIVFLFVGNAVIQGKTVVIRKIIDHTVCLRASFSDNR